MIPRFRPFRSTAVLGLLALFLGGCVNLEPQPDPTRFFTLQPRVLVAVPSRLVTVEVSQIPDYAQTRRIPYRRSGHEIAYFPFGRWTGPLEVMLAERIRERLEPWAASAGAGSWRVGVKVLVCEGSEAGEALFGADYALSQRDSLEPLREGRFLDSVSWDPESGCGPLVERLGVMIDAFADRMAAELAEGNFSRLEAEGTPPPHP
jgi:uncharacterized lipoprotein YmbA